MEVRRITAELNSRQHIFEALNARQIASLLWQIFMDTRRFFSTGINVQGNLPQSLLRNTYNEIATGIVQVNLNVPYAKLLGQDSGESSYGPKTGATVGQSQTENRTFRHVPAAINVILRGVQSKYPAVTKAEMMATHSPPLQYAQIKLGPSGSCLDYLSFGSCKNNNCSYKHAANASIATARACQSRMTRTWGWTTNK
jgi:hypothetical protein